MPIRRSTSATGVPVLACFRAKAICSSVNQLFTVCSSHQGLTKLENSHSRRTKTIGEVPFRKAWLQAIVDRVEVDADVIRIVGDKASLEAAIVGEASSATPGIRSSVRKWRTQHDLNV